MTSTKTRRSYQLFCVYVGKNLIGNAELGALYIQIGLNDILMLIITISCNGVMD